MSNVEIKIVDDNVEEVLAALEKNKQQILRVCGVYAQAQAVINLTRNGSVDTGRLRSSIEYEVEDDTMIVGTNVEYAPYIEMGTGIYAEEGGRPTPWRYVDAKGIGHWTHGQHPKPYLRPALKDHLDKYKAIIEDGLKKG